MDHFMTLQMIIYYILFIYCMYLVIFHNPKYNFRIVLSLKHAFVNFNRNFSTDY